MSCGKLEVFMTQAPGGSPIGVPHLSGVLHRRSPLSIAGTLDRLSDATS
jgi:hypothetical protein